MAELKLIKANNVTVFIIIELYHFYIFFYLGDRHTHKRCLAGSLMYISIENNYI